MSKQDLRLSDYNLIVSIVVQDKYVKRSDFRLLFISLGFGRKRDMSIIGNMYVPLFNETLSLNTICLLIKRPHYSNCHNTPIPRYVGFSLKASLIIFK